MIDTDYKQVVVSGTENGFIVTLKNPNWDDAEPGPFSGFDMTKIEGPEDIVKMLNTMSKKKKTLHKPLEVYVFPNMDTVIKFVREAFPSGGN